MKITLPKHLFAYAAALLCLSQIGSFAAETSEVRFAAKDLNGWRQPTGTWMVAQGVALDHANPGHFIVTQGKGVFVNSATNHTVDLITEAEFGDIEAHLEFCVARHSNSGIYLMGRYELQVYDSYGVIKDQYPGIECGGIYPLAAGEKDVDGRSPNVNVSKPAGAWQSFDITFRAPRFDAAGRKVANAKIVKILQNGKVIHENVELAGPTRGPMADDEKPTGPIRIQGDHGPVAYRNIRIKSVELN